MPEAVTRRPTRTSSLIAATASATAADRPSSCPQHGNRTSPSLPAGSANAPATAPLARTDKENLVPTSSQSNLVYGWNADDSALISSAAGGAGGVWGTQLGDKPSGARQFGGKAVTKSAKASGTICTKQSRNQWTRNSGYNLRRSGDSCNRSAGISGMRRGSSASTSSSVSSSSPASPHRLDYANENEGFLDDDGSDYPKSGSFGHTHYSRDVVSGISSGTDMDKSVGATCFRAGWTRRNTSISGKIVGGLIMLAMIVRAFRISQPTSVVFDEVHFGGFASKYIKGEFFMDVHPPLGKLLIALAGIVAGYDGQFDFKEIGKDYLESKVPYVAMRMMPAAMGIALVPIVYLTARRSGCSTQASVFAGLALLFENGLTTQSRHILLDSPLIFFIALTSLMWVNFGRWQHQSFSFEWWFWLTMTGWILGLAVSVKWVGLFAIALIGFYTIMDLWGLLGDLRIKPKVLLYHALARALCLIVLPAVIYMFFFELHFLALPNSGEGNGFMSAEFQETLQGVYSPSTAADVAYGSKVFIRHVATNGGYLHSHLHNYQTGSLQQQITLYPHRDDNSYFLIKNVGEPMNSTEPVWVMNGDIIRLEHVVTHRRLHSHDHRPPITDNENHNEVSAYGAENFEGDSNDNWRVEIIESNPRDPESASRLRAIQSKFRLVHVNTNCHLFSHAVKLPDYAFGQQEVTCMKNAKKNKALWRIVENVNDRLPENAEIVRYDRPGFFQKLFELNKVMWTTNQGLTDSHPFESKPITWPFLVRGISFWTKDRKQVYLLGNPFVWWAATASVVAFAVAEVVLLLRKKRGYRDDDLEIRTNYESTIGFFFAGWFFHYAPFFLMGRQLFLHHYFPALYFAVLVCASLFDLSTRRLRRVTRWTAVGISSALFIYGFLRFSFVTYGLAATRAACERARWLSSWDFDCNTFPAQGPSGGGAVLPVASSP